MNVRRQELSVFSCGPGRGSDAASRFRCPASPTLPGTPGWVGERRGLDRSESWYLRYGRKRPGDWEDPDSFYYRNEAGLWAVDRAAARVAWEEHRDELIAEAAQRGLIPWAGREFEGMPGKVSRYEDLRVDGVRTGVPSHDGVSAFAGRALPL
jgi:hypothetical protein